MTLKQQIIKAVKTENAKYAGNIASFLRHKYGCTSMQVLAIFQKYTDITAEDFELLMLESECE